MQGPVTAVKKLCEKITLPYFCLFSTSTWSQDWSSLFDITMACFRWSRNTLAPIWRRSILSMACCVRKQLLKKQNQNDMVSFRWKKELVEMGHRFLHTSVPSSRATSVSCGRPKFSAEHPHMTSLGLAWGLIYMTTETDENGKVFLYLGLGL